MEVSVFASVLVAIVVSRMSGGEPLGGRWIHHFERANATVDYNYDYRADEEDDEVRVSVSATDSDSPMDDDGASEATANEKVSNTCFKTIQECNSRCPVSCREVTDCGGLGAGGGTQFACTWDLVIIVVAVAVITAVLLLLCFLTWKQRQTRRSQLEHGRVDSSENLLRRTSRQRAESLIATTVSSTDSNSGSRRSSYQPYPIIPNPNIVLSTSSSSPTRALYPHYL